MPPPPRRGVVAQTTQGLVRRKPHKFMVFFDLQPLVFADNPPLEEGRAVVHRLAVLGDEILIGAGEDPSSGDLQSCSSPNSRISASDSSSPGSIAPPGRSTNGARSG